MLRLLEKIKISLFSAFENMMNIFHRKLNDFKKKKKSFLFYLLILMHDVYVRFSFHGKVPRIFDNVMFIRIFNYYLL